jgi:hypothetical protein
VNQRVQKAWSSRLMSLIHLSYAFFTLNAMYKKYGAPI